MRTGGSRPGSKHHPSLYGGRRKHSTRATGVKPLGLADDFGYGNDVIIIPTTESITAAALYSAISRVRHATTTKGCLPVEGIQARSATVLLSAASGDTLPRRAKNSSFFRNNPRAFGGPFLRVSPQHEPCTAEPPTSHTPDDSLRRRSRGRAHVPRWTVGHLA